MDPSYFTINDPYNINCKIDGNIIKTAIFLFGNHKQLIFSSFRLSLLNLISNQNNTNLQLKTVHDFITILYFIFRPFRFLEEEYFRMIMIELENVYNKAIKYLQDNLLVHSQHFGIIIGNIDMAIREISTSTEANRSEIILRVSYDVYQTFKKFIHQELDSDLDAFLSG